MAWRITKETEVVNTADSYRGSCTRIKCENASWAAKLMAMLNEKDSRIADLQSSMRSIHHESAGYDEF